MSPIATLKNEVLLTAAGRKSEVDNKSTEDLATPLALNLLRSLRAIAEAAEPIQKIKRDRYKKFADRNDGGEPKRAPNGGFVPDLDRLDELEDAIEEIDEGTTRVKLAKAIPVEKVQDAMSLSLGTLQALIDARVLYDADAEEEEEGNAEASKAEDGKAEEG